MKTTIQNNDDKSYKPLSFDQIIHHARNIFSDIHAFNLDKESIQSINLIIQDGNVKCYMTCNKLNIYRSNEEKTISWPIQPYTQEISLQEGYELLERFKPQE